MRQAPRDAIPAEPFSSWKLGFVGRNGCSKTTLLRLIAGEKMAYKKYAPTMPFVEHDRAFCDAVATKTLWL